MLAPVIVMLSAGFAAGICLAAASRFFNVERDWRLDAVASCLSGANCGACGYPGCASFAAAVVKGEVPVNACPGADAAAMAKMAAVMEMEAPAPVEKTAVVLCWGGRKASDRYEYHGPKDCAAMSALMGGVKNCSFGCVGGGSCALVCPTGAISMGESGLPDISAEFCIGCGLCVSECPRCLITLKGADERVSVLCSSRDKGPETRKYCSSGCIGCGICVKVCPESAIAVDDFLASIDSSLCTSCGKCVVKCPVSAISFLKIL